MSEDIRMIYSANHALDPHWVVSYGSKSLDDREEILCYEESMIEDACNLVDMRYNPDTIYVFKRPDHPQHQDAYFWKGGSLSVNGK
tara:strand:+ start:5211 stop:5468 length:258 start_codon:yes stop_codon:yes gene_type:complete